MHMTCLGAVCRLYSYDCWEHGPKLICIGRAWMEVEYATVEVSNHALDYTSDGVQFEFACGSMHSTDLSRYGTARPLQCHCVADAGHIQWDELHGHRPVVQVGNL